MWNVILNLVLAVFVGTNEAVTPDIFKVVNTTDRTWIYSATRRESEYRCAYYDKPNVKCYKKLPACFNTFRYSFDEGCKRKIKYPTAQLQEKCLVTGYRNYPCIVTLNESKFCGITAYP
ncbi:hypothetical protein MTO96_020650 [Rhipicephalus appendiculatus]